MRIKMIFTFLMCINFAIPKLQFVILLARHGARDIEFTNLHLSDNPRIGKYPLELTETGERELYVMGIEMRNRYINNKNPDFNILNSSYNAYQIGNRVATSNRTFQSGLSFLNGLYPPGTGPKLAKKQREYACPPIGLDKFCSQIDKELGYSALPNQTNSIPIMNTENVGKESTDYLSRPTSVCQPLWDYDNNISLLSYKTSLLNKEFSDVYVYLYNEWGLNDKNNLLRVIEFNDNLQSVESMGAALLKPIDDKMKQRLSNATLQGNLYEYMGRKENVYLISYFYINFIIEDIKTAYKIITDSSISFNQKFRFSGIFYSDIHIDGLIKMMHLEDQIPSHHIPFASNFIFEIEADEVNYSIDKWQVSLKYDDLPMNLNGSLKMFLPDFFVFLNQTKINSTSDFLDLCYSNPKNGNSRNLKSMIWFGGMFLFGIIILIIIKLFVKDDNENQGHNSITLL